MPRRTHAGRLAAALLIAVLLSAAAQLDAADEQVLFDNTNPDAVMSGPTKPTVFRLARATTITSVRVYHWNGGRGARNVQIRLSDPQARLSYGEWRSTGSEARAGGHLYWTCHPNLRLAPGSYEIVVTSPKTWSCNRASGMAGMAIVKGIPVGPAGPADPTGHGPGPDAQGAGGPASAEAATEVIQALKRYVDAQVSGDPDAVLAACATAGAPPQALRATRAQLARFLARYPVEAAHVVPMETSIAPTGTVAAVRFVYTSRVGSGGTLADQAGGAIASVIRQNDRWLVAGLTVDEAVTTDVFDCVSARKPPTAPLAAPRLPAPGAVYVDLDELSKWLERVRLNWHIDDDKAVMDQAMSLTGLGVTGIGDVISSVYTVKERIQTLTQELPDDVKRGNIGASLLDIALVGWGVVQLAAEVVPGADSATDQLEMLLEAGRYNFIQREGYLRIRRALERRDFSGLTRFAALRWVKGFPPEQVRFVAAPDWYGKPEALAHLRLAGDALHRRKRRLIFDVFVQVPIARQESEDLFEMAKALGMPQRPGGSPMNPVVLLKVRLTPLVSEVTKRPQPDRVLTGWRLAEGPFKRITCNLEPQPGIQNVAFRLSDGSETYRIVVANQVYNDVTGVFLRTRSAQAIQAIGLAEGEDLLDAKLVGELPARPGVDQGPPDLTGLPWVHVESREPAIATVQVSDAWPQATLRVRGQREGSTVLRVTLEGDGDTIEAKTFEIPVRVSKERTGFETHEEELMGRRLHYRYYRRGAEGAPSDGDYTEPVTLSPGPAFGEIMIHGALTVTDVATGTVVQEEFYRHGVPTGTWTTRTPDGRVTAERTFSNGRLAKEVRTGADGEITLIEYTFAADATQASGTFTRSRPEGILERYEFKTAPSPGRTWGKHIRHGRYEERRYAATREGTETVFELAMVRKGAYREGKEHGDWLSETYLPGGSPAVVLSRIKSKWADGHWLEREGEDFTRDGRRTRLVTTTSDWEAGSYTERSIEYDAKGAVSREEVRTVDREGKETVRRIR